MMWRVEADVARGCDVAQRPRAGPRVAHARRRWRGWHKHVAGGNAIHAGPRGRPCGAPRGRGVGSWRAHGLVGPGNMIGAVTQ